MFNYKEKQYIPTSRIKLMSIAPEEKPRGIYEKLETGSKVVKTLMNQV